MTDTPDPDDADIMIGCDEAFDDDYGDGSTTTAYGHASLPGCVLQIQDEGTVVQPLNELDRPDDDVIGVLKFEASHDQPDDAATAWFGTTSFSCSFTVETTTDDE